VVGRFDVPDDGYIWLTTEARQALDAIEDPQRRKKRDTVVLLACQEAGLLLREDGRPVSKRALFRDPRVCNERIWYLKWQDIPEVQTALTLCSEAAQRYADRQTEVIEAIAARRIREMLADQVGVAVETLVTVENSEKASARDRLEAARMHMSAVAPDYAARMAPVKAALPVEVRDPIEVEFGDVTPDELRDIEQALVRRQTGGGSEA